MSESVAELAAALSKAQAEIEGAKKGSVNPHYKSKYADLASVWDACREPLTTNGLSVVQTPRAFTDNGGWVVQVETILLHTSGQWIKESLTLPVMKPDAQGVGSCLTYCRRYALAAFVGIAPEDDDGNAASLPAAKATLAEPKGFEGWFAEMHAVADEGSEALRKAWSESNGAMREYAATVKTAEWEKLKAKAAKMAVPA